MKKIGIIIASVRDNRIGDRVGAWVMDEASACSENLEMSLIDLKEIGLPSMDEPVPPKAGSEYKYDHTRKWSRMIEKADGFIIVTPEYNHSFPGPLKDALDFLYREWVGKPVVLVGYGGRGAVNARRHLKDVFVSLGLVPMDEEIGISRVSEAFGGKDRPGDAYVQGSIQKSVSQLAEFLGKG